MRYLFFLIAILFVMGSLQLLAQPTHVLHKPYSVKCCFQDSILNVLTVGGKKEYISEVQSFRQWAQANDDEELAALLQLLEYRFATISPADSAYNSGERGMLKLLSANKKKSPYLNAQILQNLGYYYYFILNRNSLSFEYFLQAYNTYKDFPSSIFPVKKQYIYEFGGSYFRFGDFPNAIKYLKEALSTEDVCGFDIRRTTYNTLGICYEQLQMYDSALLNFSIARSYAIKKSDSAWIGIIGANIGAMYFLLGKNDSAIALLENSAVVCMAHTQRRSAMNAICTLADAYLRLSNIGKAELAVQRADSILREFPFLRSYKLSGDLAKVKAKLYAAKGNAAQTIKYADSALIALDSNYTEQMASNQMKVKDREQYVKQKYDREILESERQIQLLLRNSLIVLIILVLIIAILIISRQRLTQKKLMADKKYAESELAIATTKLFSFRQRENEKDELIEQLKKEDDINEELQARLQLENAILLTDEQWEGFRRQFEKVHKGFFSNLKKEIPDLTPSEVRFLALTKLKLSPKEMTAMLGVSLNAIRVYRYRLRKRLNLDKDQSIEDLVEKL